MSLLQIDIRKDKHTILPGDLIAFGGTTRVSKMIKATTRAEVSHIGMVLNTSKMDDCTDNEVLFMEATLADKKVVISNFTEKINSFDGNIWHLPLKRTLRLEMFKQEELDTFLSAQLHKPYDTIQAFKSAIDFSDHFPAVEKGLTYNEEDFELMFCSELVAGGLEVSGIVGEINASEVTPIEICSWNIFEAHYFQLKGDSPQTIEPYNITTMIPNS